MPEQDVWCAFSDAEACEDLGFDGAPESAVGGVDSDEAWDAAGTDVGEDAALDEGFWLASAHGISSCSLALRLPGC